MGKKAIQVDDEHAVLVRDEGTGQLRLVTENRLFVPGPNEVIEEVKDLVMLADHEAMIIKDKDGILHFHYGDPSRATEAHPRSFFVSQGGAGLYYTPNDVDLSIKTDRGSK